MNMEEIKFEHQTIVCKSKKTELFSIRKEGYLFWTGLSSDNWVEENDGEKIWEINDRDLVQIISELVQYSLINEKPMSEIIDTVQ